MEKGSRPPPVWPASAKTFLRPLWQTAPLSDSFRYRRAVGVKNFWRIMMKHLQGSSCFAPLNSRRWTAERYPLSPPGDPASASTQSPETAHNRFPSQPALGPVGSWKRHPAGSAPSGMFQSPFAPDRVAAFRETAQRNCAPRPRNTGWFFRPHPDPATPRYPSGHLGSVFSGATARRPS